MDNTADPPILLDLYEEHLDEAAWLWHEWEACLDSPIYTLHQTAKGPEERLLAHLDALVLGGAPIAKELLIPALTGARQFTTAAAAWALVQAEDADQQDTVLAALSAAKTPTARAAIGRALFLAPQADLSRLVPLWTTGDPEAQALVMDIVAPREPDWARQRLEPALHSGHPSLVAAALRTIRRFRDKIFVNHVQVALRAQDPTIVREAVAAGLVLGVREAWEVCRAGIELKGSARRFFLGVLAISPEAKDRERVRSKVNDPDASLQALWALGFTGDLESVDILLHKLADPGASKAACESLGLLTGLVCEGDLARREKSKGPEEIEVADDDPIPPFSHEHLLPDPQPDAVKRWWTSNGTRFRSGLRYLHGEPRHPDTLCRALTRAATWREEVLLLELATSKVGAPRVELRAWTREQLRQLGFS